MKISVRAHPGSKHQKIVLKDSIYHIYTISRARNNLANSEIVKIIAKHFKVAISKILIVKGLTSKEKIIKISQ